MTEDIRDYDPQSTEAARLILYEVFSSLGEYRRHAVLVGGWVPFMTCPGIAAVHCGSKDVDLALDFRGAGEPKYKQLRALLEGRDFREKPDSPFSFVKEIVRHGRTFTVQLDLLAQQYGGRGKRHRTQIIQDVRLRKAIGADLALAGFVEMEVEGRLPSGALNRVRIRVVKPVPFLVMKAFALNDRLKEKDAYDIFWIARYHPDGRARLAKDFARNARNKLVLQALGILREKFSGVDRLGPVSVAEFMGVKGAERDIRCREVYETMSDLLRRIGPDDSPSGAAPR